MTETVAAILQAHRSGTLVPADTVARVYERIRAYNDPAVFISLRDEAAVLADAMAVASAGPQGRQARKLASRRRPVAWLFSGWNWTPAMLSRATAAASGPA